MALKESKLPLLIAFTLLLLAIAGWLGSAEAQTQNLAYNLSWTNGAVLPDESNKPDVTIVERRFGVNTNPWTELTEVAPFPQATFQDKISADPGGRRICYRVAHRNTAGTSPFTPEACTTSPVVKKIPSVPNNNAPVVIILGPFTVP